MEQQMTEVKNATYETTVNTSSICTTDMDRRSLYFGCSHDIKINMDSIRSVHILNASMCKDLDDFLPHIDGIDYSDPVFSVDRCYLWKGNIKKPKYGSYKSPSAHDCDYSVSIVRRLFTCIFHVKLGKQILRHMCPLITGEFNSGMCCNPLHLRPGTTQENVDDRKVHEMIRRVLKDPSVSVDFCFQHNQGMFLSLPSECREDDLQLIRKLFHSRGLDYLLTKCVCNVIKVEPRNDTKDLDFVTTHWREKWEKDPSPTNSNANSKRKYERNKPTLSDLDKKEKRNVRQRVLREKKRAEREGDRDVDVIYVTAPIDRPELDVKSLWKEYVDSNPLPSGLLPLRTKSLTHPTQ